MSDEFDINPRDQVREEVAEAISDLYRPASAYHRMPWAALDRVMGGMPGGEILYVAAFSSSGKTTFLASLTDALFESTRKRIYFMGLESTPETLRKHWAAKRLGMDAGDLLSGEFLKWPDCAEVRAAVDAELETQKSGEKFNRVRFCPTPFIDAKTLYRAADQAAAFEADIFIIDHVDHIEGSNSQSDYKASREVSQAILNIAQNYNFLMMPATQLNNEAVKANRIALHLSPQPQHVKFGGHKRETATWMIGLYRPLKVAGVAPDDMKLLNAGFHKNPADCLEPNTMAVSFMKHRFYGAREWSKVYLKVERGKVMDADQDYYTARTVVDGMRVNP